MAGQFRFKNSSGAIVAQISASNAGAMSFSGSAVDFSSVTSLTLGTSTLTGTASFATAAVSSSYSNIALTGSNAMTVSSADTLYVRNNATVLGSITAQTLVVQTVTSSVDYVTGSTRFGSIQANTHEYTGSFGVTGSTAVFSGNLGVAGQAPRTGTGVKSIESTSYVIEDNGDFGIKSNAYYNGSSNIYINNGYATRIYLGAGTYTYYDAPNGTAGGTVSFTSRFFIGNGGNVGIGTTSPNSILNIVSSVTNDNLSPESQVTITNSSSGYYSTLGFRTTDSDGTHGRAGITVVKDSGSVTGAMNFVVRQNSGTFLQAMRITSAGNVGIGNTGNSSRRLEVSQPSGYSAGIRIIADSGGDAKIQFLASGGSSQPDIGPTAASPNDLIFGAGGSERMRITSFGNVGIGTTTVPNAYPGSYGLQVGTTATLINIADQAYLMNNWYYSSGGGATYIKTGYAQRFLMASDGSFVFTNTPSGTGNASISTEYERFKIAADGRVTIKIDQSANNQYLNFVGTQSSYNQEYGFGIVNGTKDFRLYDYTAGSERMRITSAGQVLINTSNSGATEALRVEGIVGGSAQYGIFVGLNATYYTSYAMRFYNSYAGTVVGSITFTTSATSYNTSSDYRLKEDLQQIDGLTKVMAIKPYNFKWIGEESRMDGVLAHELQEVLPYAVHGEKDGENMQGVDYSKIVPVLVKAVQELSAKNDSLEARLAALENA